MISVWGIEHGDEFSKAAGTALVRRTVRVAGSGRARQVAGQARGQASRAGDAVRNSRAVKDIKRGTSAGYSRGMSAAPGTGRVTAASMAAGRGAGAGSRLAAQASRGFSSGRAGGVSLRGGVYGAAEGAGRGVRAAGQGAGAAGSHVKRNRGVYIAGASGVGAGAGGGYYGSRKR